MAPARARVHRRSPPPLPRPRDAHDPPRERASPRRSFPAPAAAAATSRLGETCASGVHVRERALRANQRREEEVKPRGGGRLLPPGLAPPLPSAAAASVREAPASRARSAGRRLSNASAADVADAIGAWCTYTSTSRNATR